MNQQNNHTGRDLIRNKLLGLGEKSLKKNYFTQLQDSSHDLERFRSLLDQVNVSIIICRMPDGNIVDANNSAEKYFLEFRLKDESHHISHFLGDSFFQNLITYYKQSNHFQSHNEQPFYYMEISHKKRDFEVSVSFKKLGNDWFVTLFFHDISIQKAIEHSLQENRAYLRAIIDLISDAIFIQNADTLKIVDYNRSVYEIFGYHDNDLKNMNLCDLCVNHDDFQHGKVYEYFDKARTQGSQSFEWKAKRKNHTIIWIEFNIRFAEIGDRKTFITVIRDISERKDEEEKRLRMEQQLLHTQKLESLGILAGGIAHDFNNILTAILGHSELAILKLDKKENALIHLNEIKNASQRASELSQQMLAYSGKGRFIVEPVNINKVINEMLGLLKVSISKKVHLELRLEEDIPLFEGGVSQIRQVIMNLITNASEAIGDKEGTISIHTGIEEIKENHNNMLFLDQEVPKGNCVFFEIRDTGCGMSKEVLAKIFDPFFTTKFTGRGLGMSAILGIIKGHKGLIHVYSEVNIGTRFRIFFPALEQHTETVLITPDFDINSLHLQGKALIVDDEPAILFIAKEYMTFTGLEILTAPDGVEAVEVFKHNQKDIKLVILDLTMPNMSGEESFNIIRSLNSHVPILLMSGFSEYELSHRYSDKGFAGFIQKPFSFTDFREKVMSILLNKNAL